MRKRRDKQNPNNKPKIIKSIPIAIAVAALSSGAAFANADVDLIRVYDKDGNVIEEINVAQMNTDAAYATRVKALLKSSFKSYEQKILMHDPAINKWADLNQTIIGTGEIDDLDWIY